MKSQWRKPIAYGTMTFTYLWGIYILLYETCIQFHGSSKTKVTYSPLICVLGMHDFIILGTQPVELCRIFWKMPDFGHTILSVFLKSAKVKVCSIYSRYMLCKFWWHVPDRARGLILYCLCLIVLAIHVACMQSHSGSS